jgi:isocitrate dehydrogenase (NAD+)
MAKKKSPPRQPAAGRTITVIPGDGIGPEIADSMMRVVTALDLGLEFEVVQAGLEAYEETGELLPAAVHRSLRRNRIAIKGPTTTPVGTGHKSINVQLRQQYDLYANLRPIRLIPGVPSRYSDLGDRLDMVIFRENTEDLYAGIEHMVVPGVAESLKIITAKASERIAVTALEFARANGRRKVTVAHKANIMKISDGLFIESTRKVAKRFPEIEYEELIVDNCCMQLVVRPTHFDVVVLQNLYGDIISDLCAGLVGGLGVTPGANIGRKIAIFEAVHGSAPDIAGQGKANPTALILSAALMLRHLKMEEAAVILQKSVADVISAGKSLTLDLGGSAGTEEFTEAVLARVRRRKSSLSRSRSSGGKTAKSAGKANGKTGRKTSTRKTARRATSRG